MPKRNDRDAKSELALADAIEGLRRELTQAIETGNEQGARMRFRITEPVVLEVHAVTTKVGRGKVGWKVVELGGSYTSANTHKITLPLSPEWWDDRNREYTPHFLISTSLPPGRGGIGEADAREGEGRFPSGSGVIDEEISDD